MTPMEALRAATLSGAEYIGLDGDLGSIQPGKLADLVVLDRDPLENIRNTEAIRYVVANGRLFDGWTLKRAWETSRGSGRCCGGSGDSTPDFATIMRICLLTDAYVGSDSPLREYDLPCNPRPFLPDAEWERVVLEKSTAVRQIMALGRGSFDLFFNLCDGAWDEDRPGIEVVQTLERPRPGVHGCHLGVLRALSRGDESAFAMPGGFRRPRI